MADVTAQHSEYERFNTRATLVDDVCENNVKAKKEVYLPKPNPTDLSPANASRYSQYLLRAQFFNATGYTRAGLVGAAFSKDPEVTLPDAISYAAKDIDGAGNSINQQARSVVSQVLGLGRNGLLVDYPTTDGPLTRAEMSSQGVKATTVSINATRIINWKTAVIGGQIKLSLVVYKDDAIEDTEDGFGTEVIEQYRALRLIDNHYHIELYRKNKQQKWVLYDQRIPLTGAGVPWDVIPFIFVGAQNNDPDIDIAPLYDMASVNIGHYRNSADYEDNAYFCGQAQPWASGITESYYQMLKAEGIYIGSRNLFPVPPDGQFGITQAQPNTIVREAMIDKENQMIALGARLITPGGAVKTATEAQANSETQHSILSLVVSNVSEAYTQCLEWMLVYMNAKGEAKYKINQEFTVPHMDAQKLTALLGAVQSGKYPETDFWSELRRSGLIDAGKDDEDIREELENSTTGLGLDDIGPAIDA